MKKSLLPIFFPMYCRGYREWTGEEEAGDGSLSPPSVSPPSPSYYVKTRALIHKVLRHLTIPLYLSKQS